MTRRRMRRVSPPSQNSNSRAIPGLAVIFCVSDPWPFVILCIMSVADWASPVRQCFSSSKPTRGARLRPLFGWENVTSGRPMPTMMHATGLASGGVDQDGIGVDSVEWLDCVALLLETKRCIHLLFQGVWSVFPLSCHGRYRSSKQHRRDPTHAESPPIGPKMKERW